MPDDRNQAAIKATAQLITDDEERVAAAGLPPIPADEVIVEPNPADYLPPAYLQKTAPQLAPAFGELLGLLRDLNARFVGERTVEAQATLSLTGEHEWLEEMFRGWCQAYFEIRGSFDRMNAQNSNNPWELYKECYEEFHRLLECRILQPGTINSSVLNLSQRYMLSSFAERVLGPDLKSNAENGRDRYVDAASRANAIRLVSVWKEAVRAFTEFLRQTAQHIPPQYAPSDDPQWHADVEATMARQAEDLNFLRDVLCVLHVDDSETQQLTPDLWARMMWDVYHGGSIAAVLTSSSPEPTIDHVSEHALGIRRDGWLCHREYSWVRVQPDYLPNERRLELAVNWYVLDTLTLPLYNAWDRLDPGPVISRGLEVNATEEEQTAALAVAFIDHDTAEVESSVARRQSLPKLRLKRIRTILTNRFDCEWSMAKGSEQKVFRPGGKQFIFGCHGTDRTVYPVQIKNCLKKLGIPLVDFIAELPNKRAR